ncbi:acyltransferase [Lacimicrobium alkaliphilum]|uniref:Acyltransferase n=1 Tax=Lacimicrobium alkaliphilum TaxID=1526571 RepID=A0ABQ1R3V6_9ALTE|nr:acyltransferase [Lacimicrobium alkaliphilum]GGD57300.1 acyltransferase [Lacimicrobium alkaliphilum]
MRKMITGSIAFLAYVLNTVFWCTPIFTLSLLKLIPVASWRARIGQILDFCARQWVKLNNLNQNLTASINWDVQGLSGLKKKEWYLVIANHQSWVDILVLQRVFSGRIPFLKFFLKKELIWVPLLGLAWWALDFPFMQRFKKSYLAKNPHLKGKDLETTRRACEKFKYKPVSVMNFVEGTRWTPEKHQRQKSPFRHLLKPKAGGIAFVLSAMGDKLHKLVDVTIHYPQGAPSFWDFVCGSVNQIQVRVDITPLENIAPRDYFNEPAERFRFQGWLNQRWQHKDNVIEQLKKEL